MIPIWGSGEKYFQKVREVISRMTPIRRGLALTIKEVKVKKTPITRRVGVALCAWAKSGGSLLEFVTLFPGNIEAIWLGGNEYVPIVNEIAKEFAAANVQHAGVLALAKTLLTQKHPNLFPPIVNSDNFSSMLVPTFEEAAALCEVAAPGAATPSPHTPGHANFLVLLDTGFSAFSFLHSHLKLNGEKMNEIFQNWWGIGILQSIASEFSSAAMWWARVGNVPLRGERMAHTLASDIRIDLEKARAECLALKTPFGVDFGAGSFDAFLGYLYFLLFGNDAE